MKKRIAFLLFPDFQLLDAAGPISAFEIAERHVPGSYQLRVVAREAGATEGRLLAPRAQAVALTTAAKEETQTLQALAATQAAR